MTAADKAHGYVTEVTYPFHYYRELNPHIQGLTLTRAGLTPPTRDGRFTYLELGCGLGLATLIHAAANPHAQFVAIDIIPEHIAIAGGIAQAAGLDNVRFLELSFEDLADAGLPTFDIIAMHGVWSWINDLNRRTILAYVDKALAPGGAVYLSYNAQPGHGALMALREAMMVAYRNTGGSVPDKVEAALDFGHLLKDMDAAYFRANSLVGQYLDDITPLARNYLAHEYFNADWWSFFFTQVAADMAPLGLTFGTSAHVLDTVETLWLTADMRAVLADIPAAADRETIKDVFVNRQFRRDLFVRGAAPLDTGAALNALPFAAAVMPANVDRVAGKTMLGEVRPQADAALAVATALAAGPASLTEMMATPACAPLSRDQITEALLTMAALGAAEPALPAAGLAERKARCARLNEILWSRTLSGDRVSATASPVTGGAVGLGTQEQVFLLARARGEDPVALAASHTTGQTRDQIAAACAAFENTRMALLKNLGIV